MIMHSSGDRYPGPFEIERVGSGPNVRHNVTGREILDLNGVELPCPPTGGISAWLAAQRALWREAVEAIGWE